MSEFTGAARERDAAFAPNIRSERYLLAKATAYCINCRRPTPVVGLLVPAGHETLIDADEDAQAEWEKAARPAFLFYVELIPDAVRRQLQAIAPGYRCAISPVTQQRYWGNHCSSCGVLQEDHELYCEPDGAFLPTTSIAGSRIEWLPIGEPLLAEAAGYAPDPDFIGAPAGN